VLGEVVVGMLKVLARLQQGLGRDATHVGAGAAGRWATGGVFPFIDTSDLETKLGCTDGGNVATGATADDNDVELFAHGMCLLDEKRPLRRGHSKQGN
jgi:hypothetical protein